MNENELTDAFESILPEQPSTKGWAGAARRRRQRQRAWAGVAAVAVVAAVAIPLGLGLGNPATQVQATPAASPTQQVQPGDGTFAPDACLEAEAEYFERTDPAGGKIPDGATRLWLCGGESSPYADGLTFVGPREALTEGVDAAVSAFNDLTWREGVAIDCGSNGEVYQLLFEYPDGTTQTLAGNFSPDGCSHFNMASGIVEGADDYLRTLQGFWETQREAQEPMLADVHVCPGFTSVFDVDAADLVRGFGCVVQESSTATPNTSTITDGLPDDLLTLIRDGFPTGSTPLEGYEPTSSDKQIILLSTHGDPVTLYWGEWEGATGFAWNNPERLVWYPDEAIEKTITEYFANVVGDPDPAPTASQDTVGLTSQVCDDVQNGRIRPENLPASETLPTGAERVWLCGDVKNPYGGALGPIEPLLADPDRVVRDVNALPASDATMCTEVGGLIYHLAIDYPDGTRRVISAETVNCEVVGGWEGRTGGAKLLEAVEGYWQDQRDETTEPYIAAPALCDTFPRKEEGGPGYYSFLPVERSELTRGAVCGLPADAADFSAEPLQRWLEPELVRAIADGATTPVGDEGWRVPTGLPYLVLLNRFGDPVTYSLGTARELYVHGVEGDAQVWTPSAEMADRWASALKDFRTTPFVGQSAECEGYDPAGLTGDLSRIVSGVACVGRYAVPQIGPELEPDFARDVALRFDAEATKPTRGGWTDNYLALRDADGQLRHLYWDGSDPASLIDEEGTHAWLIPQDIRKEMERYGFDFTPE